MDFRSRFIAEFDIYTCAVVQQAKDRTQYYFRSLKQYFEVRRGTIGAMPCFVVLGMALSTPMEVMDDPLIAELMRIATDLLIIGNVSFP